MKFRFLSACAILALASVRVDAVIVYHEGSVPDLSNAATAPDFIETSPALKNDIIGIVGGTDSSDAFWFYIPVGCRLVEVELERFVSAGGNTTTFFGLYEGSNGITGTHITNANLGESDIGSGLLELGGLDSLPSGSYSIWINENTADQSYTVRIHLEAYRFDEETMGSDGLNGVYDYQTNTAFGVPSMPISMRGSQIRGTVGGIQSIGGNYIDGIQFRIPQEYELVEIKLKEYVTTGGNTSTNVRVVAPGKPQEESIFSKSVTIGDLGVNILGTQRVGTGTWNLIITETTPGQQIALYIRAAPEAWNEEIDGDLPEKGSAVPVAFVGGSAEWSGMINDSGLDLDAVYFTVPFGRTLERLLLISFVDTVVGGGCGFTVWEGSFNFIDSVGGGEGTVGEDLLDRMGIGSLGAGTYTIEVGGSVLGQTYTLRAELGRSIWEEGVNGDLSDDSYTPTPINLDSSPDGEWNDISGQIGDFASDWNDYAVFDVTGWMNVPEVVVLEYDPTGTNDSTAFQILEGDGVIGEMVINSATFRPGMVGVNLVTVEGISGVLPPGTFTLAIGENATVGNPYTIRLISDLSTIFADDFNSGSITDWSNSVP